MKIYFHYDLEIMDEVVDAWCYIDFIQCFYTLFWYLETLVFMA